MKKIKQKDDIFETTHWTLVLKAGDMNELGTEMAWQDLCKIYWYPLYAYARRTVSSQLDAEDIVQGFFLSLFQRQDLSGLSPAKGKFRAYLLASLKHYISKQALKAVAQKRGGREPLLSLDWEEAGVRFDVIDRTVGTPDEIYDREWALSLLQNVLERLRIEWKQKNKSALFDVLYVFLTIDRENAQYSDIAARHGMSENYLSVNAHRLRKRYREVLREEIGRTLDNKEMVEEEIRVLFQAFA